MCTHLSKKIYSVRASVLPQKRKKTISMNVVEVRVEFPLPPRKTQFVGRKEFKEWMSSLQKQKWQKKQRRLRYGFGRVVRLYSSTTPHYYIYTNSEVGIYHHRSLSPVWWTCRVVGKSI